MTCDENFRPYTLVLELLWIGKDIIGACITDRNFFHIVTQLSQILRDELCTLGLVPRYGGNIDEFFM